MKQLVVAAVNPVLTKLCVCRESFSWKTLCLADWRDFTNSIMLQLQATASNDDIFCNEVRKLSSLHNYTFSCDVS